MGRDRSADPIAGYFSAEHHRRPRRGHG
jgi:hypothetical protein